MEIFSVIEKDEKFFKFQVCEVGDGKWSSRGEPTGI
jgi:hypothetical protein